MLSAISRKTLVAIVGLVVVVAAVVVVVLANPGGDSPTQPSSRAESASTEAPTSATIAPPTRVPSSPTPSPTGPTSVPDRPRPKTIGIDDKASLTGGTSARLSSIRQVDGKAELPGEVGGPAIAVTVSVTAGKAIDFSQTVVNAYYGADNTPATPLSTGTTALAGSLAGGRSKTGTYVFRVPKAELGRVSIELDLSIGDPVTLFEGSAK
ncbi:hypothetical protein [Aeromicrobium sp.]|uniref:hypothetical protein n=1 Tax=Aeromicrobium sp. TaxID=1871063 RepID=UPI0019AE4546|nr:hypothetical protein [Aeromicrobium sp.]MBC7631677.1 hypothetical protein [Aeromicrobium sp.]